MRHHLAALFEDDLALIVHHVVIFQNVLAHVEVARFDFLLGLFQGLVDPGMDDRFVLLEAELDEHRLHPVGPEDPHQIVLERQEEFRASRIALAPGAAAQLIVDAAALVAFGADDIEAAGGDRLCPEPFDLGADFGFLRLALGALRQIGAFLRDPHFDIAAELNVGAAAGHIGRDGDGAGHARFGDDIGFLFVEARVQDREKFRGLVRPRRRIEFLQALRAG